ncbi:MAG: hypothetical protein ACXVB0_00745 [Mucilaginibacter sp.]
MKSKFGGWAYFVAFYSALFTIILLFCILSDIAFNTVMPAYFYVIITLAVVFVCIWAVFGEMRNKVIAIEIGFNTIIVKRYLGLGPSKIFYFDQIDGYKTSVLMSSAALYEYLYLMAGDKKIVRLSEYYHKNYAELKQLLSENFKNLGVEEYSSSRELKEIFK